MDFKKIIDILEKHQVLNEYYPCVRSMEYKDVANDIIKLQTPPNNIEERKCIYCKAKVTEKELHFNKCLNCFRTITRGDYPPH